MKKYLYVCVILFISVGLYAQSSDIPLSDFIKNNNASFRQQSPGGTSSSTFSFFIHYKTFDNCTFNTNNYFGLKLKVIGNDGTDECPFFKGEPSPLSPNTIRWGPIKFKHGVAYTITEDFAILPEDNPYCFKSDSVILECPLLLPHCCFDFDCCDCAQFEGEYEGMWLLFSPFGIPSQSSSVFLLDHVSDVTAPLYPVVPNALQNGYQGCKCCTW